MKQQKGKHKKKSRTCGNTARHDWFYIDGIIQCAKCGKVAEDQKMYIGKQ